MQGLRNPNQLQTKLTKVTFRPVGPALRATAYAVAGTSILLVLAVGLIGTFHIFSSFTRDTLRLSLVLWLVVASCIWTLASLAANFLRKDQTVLFTSGGMIFPFGNMVHLRGRRWRRWEEVRSATLLDDTERGAQLIVTFKDACSVHFHFDKMAKDSAERLLVTCETWAPQQTLIGSFAQYRGLLCDSIQEEGQKSYTALWNAELARRFHLCTFIPLAPGTKLQNGRYEIVSQMAFGGFAAVYSAVNAKGENIAIKEICLDTLQDEPKKQAVRERLDREIALLSHLDHRQICKLLDCFTENDRHYIVLERIPGKNLRQLVAEKGIFSEKQVLSAAAQMVDILTYLHGLSPPVVHRDFTPENIIMRDNGDIALIDFNAATELISGLTGTVIGKNCYMPPEQVRGKAQPESDYYAMGCTIYFMLTGQDPRPFSEIDMSSAHIPCTLSLSRLVRKLTAQEPAERPHSPTEVLVLLEAAGAPAPPG